MNTRDLAKAFNAQFGTSRTESGIATALTRRRIKCGRAAKDRLISYVRLFDSEHIQFIKDNYAGRSVAEMTDLFNTEFDLDRTRQQIKSAVDNRGINSGLTGQFKEGHKSWNKGTKGLTSANRTSFKKGSVPVNRNPLWHERLCPKDGYILMKVPEVDPHTGFPTRYKHKHIYLWEQANGPAPKGMVVAFRDGVKTNCEPENLMLISRAQLLRLNQHGYKDAPDELKLSILALAKLEVKVFGRGRR